MMPDVTRNLIGPLPRFARAFLIRMTVCILLLAAAPAAGPAAAEVLFVYLGPRRLIFV